ncbi:MAG: HEPN domain-containing protein [Bacillus sp. (in: Bacteria)]|nr:HEPN domain-containing protein [Bacillus sp. (in: firmicutes)]MCM1426068.1 HEPN domain-containing protein [Eubacterium sp.]
MMQEIREWYDMAVVDLGVAKHLYDTYYPKPLEIICYHCQQAAEKAIKALIMYCGVEGGMPKLHDLSFLLNQIKNKIQIEDRYYDYADTLTPYGVSVRYPNELFLEEKHAKEALEFSSEILIWVEEIINI